MIADDASLVNMIVEKGADPNVRSRVLQETPLTMACRLGCEEVCLCVFRGGAVCSNGISVWLLSSWICAMIAFC